MSFLQPGMCVSAMVKLFCAAMKNSFRHSWAMALCFGFLVCHICTMACSWLSQWMRILLRFHLDPQAAVAATIANNSFHWMDLESCVSYHEPMSHAPWKYAPKPSVPEASVYRCKSGEVSQCDCNMRLTPFHPGRKSNHHLISSLAWAFRVM